MDVTPSLARAILVIAMVGFQITYSSTVVGSS